MTIDVVGKSRFIARLIKMKTALDPVVEAAAITTAVEIRDTAKALAPVGTPASTGKPGYIGGSLKKSIRLQRFARPRAHTLRVGVSAGGYITNPNSGKKVDYARYVHDGTSRMPARPFLKQAYDKHRRNLPRRIKRGLR